MPEVVKAKGWLGKSGAEAFDISLQVGESSLCKSHVCVDELVTRIRNAAAEIEALWAEHEIHCNLLKAIGLGMIAERLEEIQGDLESRVQQLSLF